jgi:hypothetical protein
MIRHRVALLAVLLAASATWALPDFGPPLQTLQTLSGRVELRSQGHTATLSLSGGYGTVPQWFRVEIRDLAQVPRFFQTEAAQIQTWEGNLVVVAAKEGKAFHFAIPAIDKAARGQAAARGIALQIDPDQIDAQLSARYDLKRIDSTTAIWQGPGAAQPASTLACASSCSVTCSAGSCSAASGSNGCASCRCPASCGSGSATSSR